jgi:hypothetical protein
MGIYHLAPVGTSPGAVTSALAHLKHNKEKLEFAVRGDIVEAVVVFPSWEVRNGQEGTPEEYILNGYGVENKQRSWKKGASVLTVIRDFLDKEFGGKVILYCCPVNAGDYDDCFDKLAKTTLKFGGAGTGKHLWANITGGPNIVNAALLEVAFLSGLIARLYYTFLSDLRRYGRYLQPPSRRPEVFSWREIPLVKTVFDEDYYLVVQVLAEQGDWYAAESLLEDMAKARPERFGRAKMNFQHFKDQFLNKMDGREIAREDLSGRGTNRDRVSEYGKQVLGRIKSSSLLQLLLNAEKREKTTINVLTEDLNVEKL